VPAADTADSAAAADTADADTVATDIAAAIASALTVPAARSSSTGISTGDSCTTW